MDAQNDKNLLKSKNLLIKASKMGFDEKKNFLRTFLMIC